MPGFHCILHGCRRKHLNKDTLKILNGKHSLLLKGQLVNSVRFLRNTCNFVNSDVFLPEMDTYKEQKLNKSLP